MQIIPGSLLISTATMDDPVFKTTQVLITEYNDKGSMGFVINKRFHRPLNELVEFQSSPAFPLYDGGPVDQEHLYFIHRRPDLIGEGVPLREGLFLGGNFKETIKHINKKAITPQDVKLFVGYCGWDFNELDTEIHEGFWDLMPPDLAAVFTSAM